MLTMISHHGGFISLIWPDWPWKPIHSAMWNDYNHINYHQLLRSRHPSGWCLITIQYTACGTYLYAHYCLMSLSVSSRSTLYGKNGEQRSPGQAIFTWMYISIHVAKNSLVDLCPAVAVALTVAPHDQASVQCQYYGPRGGSDSVSRIDMIYRGYRLAPALA